MSRVGSYRVQSPLLVNGDILRSDGQSETGWADAVDPTLLDLQDGRAVAFWSGYLDDQDWEWGLRAAVVHMTGGAPAFNGSSQGGVFGIAGSGGIASLDAMPLCVGPGRFLLVEWDRRDVWLGLYGVDDGDVIRQLARVLTPDSMGVRASVFLINPSTAVLLKVDNSSGSDADWGISSQLVNIDSLALGAKYRINFAKEFPSPAFPVTNTPIHLGSYDFAVPVRWNNLPREPHTVVLRVDPTSGALSKLFEGVAFPSVDRNLNGVADAAFLRADGTLVSLSTKVDHATAWPPDPDLGELVHFQWTGSAFELLGSWSSELPSESEYIGGDAGTSWGWVWLFHDNSENPLLMYLDPDGAGWYRPVIWSNLMGDGPEFSPLDLGVHLGTYDQYFMIPWFNHPADMLFLSISSNPIQADGRMIEQAVRLWRLTSGNLSGRFTEAHAHFSRKR